jgi:antitoxin component YwqK of YwqJK toxin-antitoxin module
MAMSKRMHTVGLVLAASIVACEGQLPSVERRVLFTDFEGEPRRIEWYVLASDSTVSHGPIRLYDTNNVLRGLEQHDHGRVDGYFVSFWPNGRVMKEGYAEHGRNVGFHFEYHENGVLAQEREYRDDLLWRVVGVYDTDCRALDAGTLADGNGHVKEYFESGALAREGPYRNGLREGEWTFYLITGDVMTRSRYSAGRIVMPDGSLGEREY